MKRKRWLKLKCELGPASAWTKDALAKLEAALLQSRVNDGLRALDEIRQSVKDADALTAAMIESKAEWERLLRARRAAKRGERKQLTFDFSGDIVAFP